MLAQNFKTAADLGITEAQVDALRKTLVLAETGKLIHAPNAAVEGIGATSFTGHFNMDKWSWRSSRGSVCCIGGTAELVGGLKRESFDAAALCNKKLYQLFYPDAAKTSDWSEITPAQAATALRSYLTTGNARWDLAVA